MEQTDFGCTIGLADIRRRADLLDALVPRVLARRREEFTLTIDFPAAAAENVRGFIAEESKCCPFFSFRLDQTDEGVRLVVGTPPGGDAMLDALEIAFDPSGSTVLARLE